jgi:TRAP-type transport system periplasmic protein
MQSRHVHLTLTLIVGGSLVVSGCTSAVDKAGGEKGPPAVVLHVLNTRAGEELQPFVDKVNELSEGSLRLEVENKWHKTSLSSERDAIHATQAARTDLAVVPARAWHGVGVTSFDALIAPLTVDSLALQQKVLATTMPTDMMEGLTPLNLTGIGVLPGPMRRPAGITRSLLGPADYRGGRLGFSPSDVGDRSLRALGACTPTAAIRRSSLPESA